MRLEFFQEFSLIESNVGTAEDFIGSAPPVHNMCDFRAEVGLSLQCWYRVFVRNPAMESMLMRVLVLGFDGHVIVWSPAAEERHYLPQAALQDDWSE